MLPQLRTQFYEPYAQRLSSYGYAVVQYQLPLLHTVDDSVEVS